jgi:uncharacterized membrane protein YfcA
VVLGLVLFLVGNIGARTGLVILRFDPPHVYTQLGGAVLAIVGLSFATGGSSKRKIERGKSLQQRLDFRATLSQGATILRRPRSGRAKAHEGIVSCLQDLTPRKTRRP